MSRVVNLNAFVTPVENFPSPGILFQDLTPLMRDASALKTSVAQLVEPFRSSQLTAVAGIDARGFIFGAMAAAALNVGFIPIRKPGKLPRATQTVDYALEYGTNSLAIHQDALDGSDRMLLIDDVLATGGTAAAGITLLERSHATIVACAFVLEIAALNGRALLKDIPAHVLLQR